MREFCLWCGAGLGMRRREGEGTCPRCHPITLIGGDDILAMLKLAGSTPPGAFMEVGVYQGGSALPLAQLAHVQNRQIWLCDTFTGIPYTDEAVDSHKVGDFKETSYRDVAALMCQYDCPVIMVKGIFPQSMRGVIEPASLAFVHLDVDQYQSYKDAFAWLEPRMAKGGVIQMDDVDKLQGATRAATERYGVRIDRSQGRPFVRFW